MFEYVDTTYFSLNNIQHISRIYYYFARLSGDTHTYFKVRLGLTTL